MKTKYAHAPPKNDPSQNVTSCSMRSYLGGDGCCGDVGGGAVLRGRHTAVFLFLILVLALHALVLRLTPWRTVGRRRQRRRRRRQVLQLVRRLLNLHHGVTQEVDGVWQRRQDELEAFLSRTQTISNVHRLERKIGKINISRKIELSVSSSTLCFAIPFRLIMLALS